MSRPGGAEVEFCVRPIAGTDTNRNDTWHPNRCPVSRRIRPFSPPSTVSPLEPPSRATTSVSTLEVPSPFATASGEGAQQSAQEFLGKGANDKGSFHPRRKITSRRTTGGLDLDLAFTSPFPLGFLGLRANRWSSNRPLKCIPQCTYASVC